MNHRLVLLVAVLLTMLWGASPTAADEDAASIRFPERRPPSGSFVRPREEGVIEVTPPGFCWWRAAPRGKIRYRLSIVGVSEKPLYESAPLDDPVCVPERVLPAGKYQWTVEAIDAEGRAADRWGPRAFAICRRGLRPAVDPRRPTVSPGA